MYDNGLNKLKTYICAEIIKYKLIYEFPPKE
jgi:hypothetical protein